MKLSVYIGVIFHLLLAFVPGVHAQTPTPHPNALDPGLYRFEDLSSPDIELTGSWSIASCGLRATSNGASLTFNAHSASGVEISYITVRDTDEMSDFTICVDAVCLSDNNRSHSTTHEEKAIPIESNAEVVITKTSGAARPLCLIYMDIGISYNYLITAIESISGTGGGGDPDPESTPEPYYIYGSVSGTDGDVSTRFDMIVTVGDVAIASALLFLLFSGWAFIFLKYLVKRDG